MNFLTTATLNWFDDGCCDVKYLDLWNDAPLNYYPGQPLDDSWHRDQTSLLIGYDPTGELFATAVSYLMQYRFYPTEIMTCVGDFNLEDRQVKVGDRIVQRIHLLRLFGRPILDAVTMTEVIHVINEPRRRGFTYVTVDTHVEQGEWTAVVEWQKNNNLMLTLKATSRPVPNEPARNYKYMRSKQNVAHLRGMDHFKNVVLNTNHALAKS